MAGRKPKVTIDFIREEFNKKGKSAETKI